MNGQETQLELNQKTKNSLTNRKNRIKDYTIRNVKILHKILFAPRKFF